MFFVAVVVGTRTIREEEKMLLVKKARRPHPSHMTFRPVGSAVEPFLAGYSSSSSTLPEVHQVHAIPGDPPSHPENLLTINALIPAPKDREPIH